MNLLKLYGAILAAYGLLVLVGTYGIGDLSRFLK